MIGEFTSDWSSTHYPSWRAILTPMVEQAVSILEIGSFEGRSAEFFLDYLPHASITCVDPFDKAHGRPDVERRFDDNVSRFGKRVEKIKAYSWSALPTLVSKNRSFDVIYIDGSHTRDDVMIDSIFSWRMLRSSGILIWDDFLWRGRADQPAPAIRSFLRLHKEEYQGISFHHQVIICRTKPVTFPWNWHLQRLRTEAKLIIKTILSLK